MKPELTLRLRKEAEKKILGGFPWIYKGDYIESSEQVIAEPGALADVVTSRGAYIGTGYFNPASQIACRLLTRKKEPIDTDFFIKRMRAASAKREALFPEPYWRAVHSEGDDLPGLLIDRFGGILVLQTGTLGMERLLPLILEAAETVFSPAAILLRNDNRARTLEGLPLYTRIIKGNIPDKAEVHENDCIYLADLQHGQKTGWFYDQRGNRALLASHAKDKTVLDAYSHSGGFGLLAAKMAKEVTLLDSSALALSLARDAAALNQVTNRCHFLQADALEEMERMHKHGMRFDCISADPPPFIKSKKDLHAGLRAYEKIARASATLVSDNGLMMIASCSHHATRPLFRQAVLNGIHKSGRQAHIIAETGVAPDHPVHPHLPQSGYLKSLLLHFQNNPLSGRRPG